MEGYHEKDCGAGNGGITSTSTVYYTVKFDPNGGSMVYDRKVEKGKTIRKLPATIREGYIFKGWYNGKIKWTTTKEVNENLTLKASWKKGKIDLAAKKVSLAYYEKEYTGKARKPGVVVKNGKRSPSSWLRSSG